MNKKKIFYYYTRLCTEIFNFEMRTKMNKYSISHISMFHDICLDSSPLTDDFACRVSDFNNYIDECEKYGIKFVSLDNLLEMNPHDAIKSKAVITFDDGYESVYTIATPILTKMGIPYTVYVTTSFLDKKNYLSTEQLINLSKNPLCTIGMHANEHVMFRDTEKSFLENDFYKCRDTLSKITERIPKHYAFPYGSMIACSNSNINTIRNLGVNSIALTKQLKLKLSDIKKPYRLPRLNIPGYYNGTVKFIYRGLPIGGHND